MARDHWPAPRGRVGPANAVPHSAGRVVRGRHSVARGHGDALYGPCASVRSVRRGSARAAQPRPYQSEALSAWQSQQGRGVVVLPTGSGKSHLAMLAIADKRRSTLVVAPTLDLVRQWFDLLKGTFGVPVGVVGGGEHDVQRLTVTTYDSAMLHMDHLGSRFGLVVFDECHHLPSASYAMAARSCMAPFRLGLTATPERSDGREADLDALIGPVVYRKDIVELSGDYLAEYETQCVSIALSPEERTEHDEARAIYRAFVQKHHIRMSQPSGWREFILFSSQSAEGRRAIAAYRRQRSLALAPRAKLEYLEHLLSAHPKGPGDSVHARQRDGVRDLASLSGARHHPSDQGARTKRGSRRPRRGNVQRRRHVQGPQRGRRHSRRERGGHSFRERIRPRARPAARSHSSKERKQASDPLRARHASHDGDVYERSPTRAQCLPLISSARGGGPESCFSCLSTRPHGREPSSWLMRSS